MREKPARPPKRGDMPHALTFFVSDDERSAVLRCLRRHDKDRRLALLRALGATARESSSAAVKNKQ